MGRRSRPSAQQPHPFAQDIKTYAFDLGFEAVCMEQRGEAALLLGNHVDCLQAVHVAHRDVHITAERGTECFDFMGQFLEHQRDCSGTLGFAILGH